MGLGGGVSKNKSFPSHTIPGQLPRLFSPSAFVVADDPYDSHENPLPFL